MIGAHWRARPQQPTAIPVERRKLRRNARPDEQRAPECDAARPGARYSSEGLKRA